MLLMFAKQTQHIRTLVQILRSKGILEGDDAAAFDFATRADAPANAVLVLEVAKLYAGFALNLGMDPVAILQDLPKSHPAPE